MEETQKAMETKMCAALLDECEGVESYSAMAKEAPEKYRPILMDIAKEEHTHMMHVKRIMDDMGIPMTDELKSAYDKAESAYRSFF